ncbi:MAG: hypothetical protein QOE51_2998 [Actinoplanes sp.]|jgi:hypothetical protein|nr:hypothetical protein [Actinoplanes sp.]
MTSISAASPATSTAATYATYKRQDPMAKVADALGLSKDDLKKQLKSGKSLADIATAQGVSHDDLITAIKAGLPSDASSSVNATAMAEKMATQKGGPQPPSGHHGHGGHGGPKGLNTGVQDPDKLQQLSQLLDSSTTDVSSSAASATDLVKLLKDKGVDLSALRNVLNSGDLVDVSA